VRVKINEDGKNETKKFLSAGHNGKKEKKRARVCVCVRGYNIRTKSVKNHAFFSSRMAGGNEKIKSVYSYE